jgi:hypothetical protein
MSTETRGKRVWIDSEDVDKRVHGQPSGLDAIVTLEHRASDEMEAWAEACQTT